PQRSANLLAMNRAALAACLQTPVTTRSAASDRSLCWPHLFRTYRNKQRIHRTPTPSLLPSDALRLSKLACRDSSAAHTCARPRCTPKSLCRAARCLDTASSIRPPISPAPRRAPRRRSTSQETPTVPPRNVIPRSAQIEKSPCVSLESPCLS